MKIDFWVEPKGKKFTVVMRVSEPIQRHSNFCDFDVKTYTTADKAHMKVASLREAAKPLMKEIPMCYKNSRIHLSKERAPLPVSHEAK